MRFFIQFLLLLCFTGPVIASENPLDYLYSPDLPEKEQLLLDRVTSHARNSEFDYASELSTQLIDAADDLQNTSATTYGQLLVNHGIIQAGLRDYAAGLQSIDAGLAYMELQTNPFSRELINGVMAKGVVEMALEAFTAAEDSFRRAQHITHRQGGVYSEEQLPMLQFLTTTHLRQARPYSADREQLFTLRIAEQVYGPDSVELLPILSRLGSYFATRGSTIPAVIQEEIRFERDQLFKYSINMYQRAVTIIEQNFGENDLRLVKPLRGLASARMLQVTNRKYAEAALARSLAIVDSNPDSDITDRAQALIDLADLYAITSDKRSGETYLRAWNMLQENEHTRELANNLFGTPKRLFPRQDPMLYLDRMPDAATEDTQLHATLEYNVASDGSVKNVRVIERNVPNEQVRNLRQRIRKARYRPRIEDGELKTTEGLTLYQPFEVIQYTTYEPDEDATDESDDD